MKQAELIPKNQRQKRDEGCGKQTLSWWTVIAKKAAFRLTVAVFTKNSPSFEAADKATKTCNQKRKQWWLEDTGGITSYSTKRE